MWTGVGDGVGDTPQTVTTTRAPAVLKTIQCFRPKVLYWTIIKEFAGTHEQS